MVMVILEADNGQVLKILYNNVMKPVMELLACDSEQHDTKVQECYSVK